jgi:hypothetical protein
VAFAAAQRGDARGLDEALQKSHYADPVRLFRVAARNGHVAALRVLLKYYRPLLDSCAEWHLQAVHGGATGALQFLLQRSPLLENLHEIMYAATAWDNVAIVHVLLTSTLGTGPVGISTAFSIAVQNGAKAAADLLLQLKADVHGANGRRCYEGMSHATVAAMHGDVDLLRVMHRHGLMLDDPDVAAPCFFAAALNNRVNALEYLLPATARRRRTRGPACNGIANGIANGFGDRAGNSINSNGPASGESRPFLDMLMRRTQGTTPLHVAVRFHKSAAMRFLLGVKVDVNTVDDKGNTPLLQAILHGSTTNIEALVAAKADVNTANSFGTRPLHGAVSRNMHRIATGLLRARADPTLTGAHGRTALQSALARKSMKPALLRLLSTTR